MGFLELEDGRKLVGQKNLAKLAAFMHSTPWLQQTG